jgi:CRISPR-associated DxTHG motif protein
MRKIITFLGKYPKETQYEFEGKVYSGKVFAEALRQFVAFDEMLVCITEEARTDAWPVLAALNDSRIREVSIHKGETTAELWDMFDTITAQVNERETVIFDITHGLRSLPFLVFLFAAYLKSAKQVTIEAIYYGAFELGDPKLNKPAPVIDMSEFIKMLDWLTATDQFVQTGDARRLAELLNPKGVTSGAAVQSSDILSRVSLSAFLCQPFQLMSNVGELSSSFARAETELALQAHPFKLVRRQVEDVFGAFSATGIETDPSGVLRAQMRLIEWYVQNNQIMQAMTLAREWLISAVTFRLGRPIVFGRTERGSMESAVNGLSRVGREETDPLTGEMYIFQASDLNEFGRTIQDTWPEREEIKKLWDNLSPVRNVLNHAGHQPGGGMKVNKIADKANNQILNLLRQLAQKWGLA